MIKIKYVIAKSFRDPTGFRLPGEIIELTPSRASALRECGIIGEEYKEPQESEPKTSLETSTNKATESTKRPSKPLKKKEQRKAGK